jgi:hypothetical protein
MITEAVAESVSDLRELVPKAVDVIRRELDAVEFTDEDGVTHLVNTQGALRAAEMVLKRIPEFEPPKEGGGGGGFEAFLLKLDVNVGSGSSQGSSVVEVGPPVLHAGEPEDQDEEGRAPAFLVQPGSDPGGWEDRGSG